MRQQQLDAAVAEHVGQPFGGVIRIEWHVGATGLDDRQQSDQQLRRALGGNGHAHIRTDAFVAQVVGQTIGLGVQFGEIEAATVPQQRGAFRCLTGLLVEQFRQPLAGGWARSHGPFGLLIYFSSGQQWQITDGGFRLFTDGAQQAAVVLGQAFDGRGIEQLAGVVEGQAQAPVAIFFAVQLQVELGLATVPRQFLGKQPG